MLRDALCWGVPALFLYIETLGCVLYKVTKALVVISMTEVPMMWFQGLRQHWRLYAGPSVCTYLACQASTCCKKAWLAHQLIYLNFIIMFTEWMIYGSQQFHPPTMRKHSPWPSQQSSPITSPNNTSPTPYCSLELQLLGDSKKLITKASRP